MYIYKTNFSTEAEGKQALIDKNVWREVTEEGVTQMVYINGTKAIVNIGKIVKTPGTYGPDGEEITAPVYYDGWAYDVMSSDILDFGSNLVHPGDASAHSFFGWPRNTEGNLPVEEKEEESEE